MLMIAYNKLLLLTSCGLLCAYLKIRVLSYICGPCKPQSYRKMGLHIFLYVPSDLVSNSRVDRYVHFSGPIFVYEVHFKKPQEFASLANI